MASTTVPEFFQRFPMRQVDAAGLDAVLAGHDALTILFLWGHDCPNCDLAKRQILADPGRYQWPSVRWLHANVYEDPAIGTRFGLHGVPAFMVFRGTRRLGRISPWPGPEPFCTAIGQLL